MTEAGEGGTGSEEGLPRLLGPCKVAGGGSSPLLPAHDSSTGHKGTVFVELLVLLGGSG